MGCASRWQSGRLPHRYLGPGGGEARTGAGRAGVYIGRAAGCASQWPSGRPPECIGKVLPAQTRMYIFVTKPNRVAHAPGAPESSTTASAMLIKVPGWSAKVLPA